jgi:hypothetical protein
MARKGVKPDTSAKNGKKILAGRGGEKVEQKEMLLASFGRQLSLVRGFDLLEPENLGRKMAECFIVEVRVRLATSDNPRVELSAVGTLLRARETVSFQPDEVLKNDAAQGKLQLGEFFDKQGGPSHLWGGFTWRTVFRKSEEPYLGLNLLARLGSQFLRSLMSQDQRLERVSLDMLLEGLCLGVHDAICCGTGIELETIGTFYPYPSLSFKPDDILLDTIRSTGALARANTGTSGLKVSELRVGPLPKV